MKKSTKAKTLELSGTLPALTDFKAWGKRLRRSYRMGTAKLTKREEALPQRDRKGNAFKRAAYGYLRDLRQAGLAAELQEYVESRDKPQWTGHEGPHALWVMRLVTKNEQTVARRQARKRFTAELSLADANDVRPDLLLGFLYEAGPGSLIKKAAEVEKRYKWASAYRVSLPTAESGATKAKKPKPATAS